MTILASFELGDRRIPTRPTLAQSCPATASNRRPAISALVPVGDAAKCASGPDLMKATSANRRKRSLDEAAITTPATAATSTGTATCSGKGASTTSSRPAAPAFSPKGRHRHRPHPRRQAHWRGRPHDTLSEMVVATSSPSSAALDETGVITELKKQLASYKVPRRLLFFDEQDFALTGNEKSKP